MVEENYSTGYSAAPGFRGIRAQSKLDNRYLTEDVGFGMVFLSDLGRQIGVPTPVMDAIIEIASVVMARDFRGEARRTMAGAGLSDRAPGAAARALTYVPTGCQAVLSSTNGSIRVRLSSPRRRGSRLAGRRATRVTLSAARRTTSGSPVVSSDRVDVAVPGQRLDELRAQAGEQVHDAGRDVGHAEHLAEVQRQQRPALGHDRDDHVARPRAAAGSRRRGRARRAPRARSRRRRRSARGT